MDNREFSGWEELADSITDADRVRHTPPPQVWNNIQAAIKNSETETASVGAETETDDVAPRDDVIDLTAERNERAPATARKRRRQMILTAAASVLAVVAGLSLFNNSEPVETLVANVTNDTLPEEYSGTATAMVELDDAPMLEITFEDELPTDEPVELWVIKTDPVDGDIVDMRSLGIVKPSETSWSRDWPVDLDPAEYSVVDLSIEPDDGDPTHSGRSILRGVLGSL